MGHNWGQIWGQICPYGVARALRPLAEIGTLTGVNSVDSKRILKVKVKLPARGR